MPKKLKDLFDELGNIYSWHLPLVHLSSEQVTELLNRIQEGELAAKGITQRMRTFLKSKYGFNG